MTTKDTGERYWQNWDQGEAAKRIDAYWLAEEGAYRTSLVTDIRSQLGRRVQLLEVGCGTGLIFGELLRQGVVTRSSYTGGDVSQNMLGIARQRFPQTQFRELDAFAIACADASQDNVICIHVLQHLPGYEQVVRELVRVTRRRLYIACWFTNRLQDEVQFSEPSSQWDGQSFHNNSYALAKFISALLSASEREVADLRVRHAGGRNYTICLTFSEPGIEPPRTSLKSRVAGAVRGLKRRITRP